MQWLSDAIGWVVEKLMAILGWVADMVTPIFEAAWTMVTDAGCWLFASVLDLAIGILGTFSFSAFATAVGSWSGLPDKLLEVVAALGLSTAMGLIVTAIGIRLVLQLIPFTRLGS